MYGRMSMVKWILNGQLLKFYLHFTYNHTFIHHPIYFLFVPNFIVLFLFNKKLKNN